MKNKNPAGPVTAEVPSKVLATGELSRLDAYWRAANYLSVGQG